MTIASGAPEAVFAALADPTRRAILEWLEQDDVGTATAFAARLPISRQAVSKHLAELADAGLIVGTKRGREMQYELNPDGFTAAAVWLEQRAARWDDRLAALARHVEGDEETGG